MTAVDNANGNKFEASTDILLIVHNPTGGALTFNMTSQAISGGGAGTGRTGNVSQSIAAGEIRVFRLTKNGWEDSSGNVLIPSGVSASLKVGIVVLQ
jgi:hypothetical protein